MSYAVARPVTTAHATEPVITRMATMSATALASAILRIWGSSVVYSIRLGGCATR